MRYCHHILSNLGQFFIGVNTLELWNKPIGLSTHARTLLTRDTDDALFTVVTALYIPFILTGVLRCGSMEEFCTTSGECHALKKNDKQGLLQSTRVFCVCLLDICLEREWMKIQRSTAGALAQSSIGINYNRCTVHRNLSIGLQHRKQYDHPLRCRYSMPDGWSA